MCVCRIYFNKKVAERLLEVADKLLYKPMTKQWERANSKSMKPLSRFC